MAVPWETVRVFISSTFDDMHAERDYLVKQVFPELREWCEKRRLRLVDIDLRWGVKEEDTQNKNVVEVCLRRIDEARPFFLCFLGQRRGWVPKEGDISLDTLAEDAFPDLQASVGKASVTEMEILHALIDPFHRSRRNKDLTAEYYQPVKYALFYLRDRSYLDQLPAEVPSLRKVYTNAGIKDEKVRQDADQELERWVEQEIPALCEKQGRPVRYYTAKWDPTASSPELLLPLACPSLVPDNVSQWQRKWADAGITVSGTSIDTTDQATAENYNKLRSSGRLTGFECDRKPLSQMILEDLQAAISARYPERTVVTAETDLQQELDQQEQFIFTVSQGFIERGGDFDALDAYLTGDSRQLFVLTAPSGMGKSTLLAKWIDRCRQQSEGQKGQSIHFRFIGQSDRSTTVYSLLQLLLREIQETTNKLTDEIPDDPQKLRREFPRLLAAAGKSGKTVIVLDALNQLVSGLADLNWLPYRLPENVKLIVSFKRGGQAAENLYERMHGQALVSEVRPFEKREHRQELVNKYLEQYLKQLDQPLLDALINLPGASNPLYLKVVLSELRIYGAFASLGEKIRSDFGETPVTAFEAVLRRLESDPAYSPIDPKRAVPLLFGLLAHARYGLSAGELTGLFLQALALNHNETQRQACADTVHLYLLQVRSFLARRDGRYDFFFESLKLAVQRRYVAAAAGGPAPYHREPVRSPSYITEGVGEFPPRWAAAEWHMLLAEYFYQQPLYLDGALKIIPNLRKLSEQVYQEAQGLLCERVIRTVRDYPNMKARVDTSGPGTLIEDFDLALQSITPYQSRFQEDITCLRLLRGAINLSAGALRRDPAQLNGHLLGRLGGADQSDRLPACTAKVLEQVKAYRERTWLSPLTASLTQAGGPLVLRIFLEKPVEGLPLVAPDAKCLLAASHESIKVWDLQSGEEKYNLQLPPVEDSLSSKLRLYVRGSWVYASNPLFGILAWDLETGRRVLDVERNRISLTREIDITEDGQKAAIDDLGRIRVLDLPGERDVYDARGEWIELFGQFLAFRSPDQSLKVVELASGKEATIPRSHGLIKKQVNYSVAAVIETDQGWFAVTYTDENGLNVWSLDWPKLLYTYRGQTDEIDEVRILKKSRRVITRSESVLKVWELLTGKEHLAIQLPKYSKHLAVSDDESCLATWSGNEIRVWDLERGTELYSVRDTASPVTVIPLPAQRRLFSASKEKIDIFDLTARQKTEVFGHRGAVTAMTVSPGGQTLLTGSVDKTIRVWDLGARALRSALEGHTSAINSLATDNGRRIVSGSQDRSIRIWSLKNAVYTQDALLGGEEGDVISRVYLSKEGESLVSSSQIGVRCWDLQSKRGTLFVTYDDRIYIHVMTPDGAWMLGCSERYPGNPLYLWDTTLTQSREQIETGRGERVKALAITPDGKLGLVFYAAGALVQLDLAKKKVLKNLQSNLFAVLGAKEYAASLASSAVLTPDGSRAVITMGNKLQAWDLVKGVELCTLTSHSGLVTDLALSPNGGILVSVSTDCTLRMWDLERGEQICAFYDDEPLSFCALLLPGRIICAGESGGVHLLEVMGPALPVISEKPALPVQVPVPLLRSAEKSPQVLPAAAEVLRPAPAVPLIYLLRQLAPPLKPGPPKIIPDSTKSTVLTPNGRLLLSSSTNGTVWVWDYQSGQLLQTLRGHSDPVNVVIVAPGGRQALSGSNDLSIKVWDLESGECLVTLNGHQKPIYGLAVTPDGTRMVSASWDKTIKLWDLPGRVLLRMLARDDAEIKALILTTDGRQVISGSYGNKIKVWELESGELLRTLEGHTDKVTSLALTPDGRQVVSGSWDNTVRVWDLASGKLLRSLTGHSRTVMAVAVTPDNRRIVSAGDDLTLRVWDLESGRQLQSFKHTSTLLCLAVTSDGRQAVTGSVDNTLQMWALDGGQQ